MLLNEILTKNINNLKVSGKNPINDFMGSDKTSILGIGAQAIAYLHEKYPNKIIKTIQISGSDDPQYQFIRLCYNNQNNPYFPKIYAVKLFKSKKVSNKKRWEQFDDEIPPSIKKQVMVVVMERLHPLTSISKQDLEQKGLLPEINDIAKKWQVDMIKSGKIPEKDIVSRMFRMAFENQTYRKRILSLITDRNLKNAIRLMEPLFKHYHPDVHTGNIMIRSPNQWVFIDPVSKDE